MRTKLGIANHPSVAKHLQNHLCHKNAGKHVAYVRVARKKLEVQNHKLLIVSSLPGVNGQNVPSLAEKECKKEQGQ